MSGREAARCQCGHARGGHRNTVDACLLCACARYQPSRKYRNVKVACEQGGVLHMHDSKAERARCWVLHQRLAAGEIVALERQPRYELRAAGQPVAVYVADFRYDERGADGRWWPVTEDVKGVRTPAYRLKARLMAACHGIKIRETS